MMMQTMDEEPRAPRISSRFEMVEDRDAATILADGGIDDPIPFGLPSDEERAQVRSLRYRVVVKTTHGRTLEEPHETKRSAERSRNAWARMSITTWVRCYEGELELEALAYDRP